MPVMVFRGYSSLSFLHSLAEEMRHDGRPAFVDYFGDWDPSGKDIERAAIKEVREQAADVDIYFERIAVTPQQIAGLRLPTRPPKSTDTGARDFAGGTAEIEAIPPAELRDLVEICIARHIDERSLWLSEDIARLERATLRSVLATGFPDGTYGAPT